MTIFEKIVAGEIPSYKVAETEEYLAFLDVFPLRAGHTLVIPKRPEDYIFDLEDDTLSGLMVFAKKVARAMDQAFDSQRVGVAVIGLEVPHAHVHLVPINEVADIDFSQPKLSFSEEEFKAIAEQIKAQF